MGFNSVMKSTFEQGKTILSSRYFWIIVIIIILVLLARKYWNYLSDKFQSLSGNFKDNVSDERKDDLRNMSENISSAINPNVSSFWDFDWARSDREDLLWSVYNLNGSEFKFLVENYRDRHGSFEKHLNGAYLPLTNADEKLVSRIERMGI